MYWIGVAVKMKYGVGSSGATTRDAIEPLTNAFGLGYVHWADSYKYAPEAWIPMLNNELQAGRPIRLWSVELCISLVAIGLQDAAGVGQCQPGGDV